MPEPKGVTAPSPPPFFGRARELDILHTAYERAQAGETSFVLVSGESGIGKTALVEHFARLVADNAEVRFGRCWDGGDAPPFWPWTQILAALSTTNRGELSSDHGGAALVETLTAVANGRSSSTIDASAQGGRLQLFDAVSELLSQGALDRPPLLLVIDDIQWADADSLALLRYLVQDDRPRRLLLVAMHRDEEPHNSPLTETLATIARSPRATTVRLPGLTEDDVAACASARLDRDLDRVAVANLRRRTNGNAFFVTETIRQCAQDDEARLDILVADTVADVVRRQLASLAAPERALLDVAAVIGSSLSLGLLTALLPGAPPPIKVLDKLERAHLLIGSPSGSPAWWFTHDIVRDVVYGELTTARRADLHRQVATALESSSTSGSNHPYESLAYHWSRVGTDAGRHAAADFYRRAGDAAREVFAHEDAAAHYEHAAAHLGHGAASEVARLLIAAAEELFLAGFEPAGRELVRRATAIASSVHDYAQMARAAVTMSRLGGRVNADEEAIDLLEAATSFPIAPNSGLGVEVHSRLALEVRHVDLARALMLSERALSEARALGDLDSLATALASRRYVILTVDTLEEQLAIGDEIVGLASRARRLDLIAGGHYARIQVWEHLGDFAAVDAEVRNLSRVAEAIRRPHDLGNVELFAAMRAEMEGRYDDAWAALSRAQDIASRSNDNSLALNALPLELILLQSTMNFDRAVQMAQNLSSVPAVATVARAFELAIRSSWTADVGPADVAACVADLGDRAENWFWFAGAALTAAAAYYTQAPSTALLAHERLRSYADRGLIVPVNPTAALGPAQFYAGLAAAAAGAHADAAERLEAAVDQSQRLGALPWVLRALTALVQLRQSAGRRHRDLGPLLRQANDVAAALPGCSAVDEFRRATSTPANRQLTGGLTEREREVLGHASQGLRNEDIAARLHVSVKTVERHLTNSYAKLAVRNRAEAIARIVGGSR